MNLREHTWPRERAGEAIAAIARSVGWPLRDGALPRTTDVEHAASWLGLEAEPVDVAYEDVDRLVCAMGTAAVDVGPSGILAIIGTTKRRCALVLPDGSHAHVSPSALRAALVADLEAERGPAVDRNPSSGLGPRAEARPRAARVA